MNPSVKFIHFSNISIFSEVILPPTSIVVCLVCVCCVSRSNSRTERSRKLTIGRMQAHHTLLVSFLSHVNKNIIHKARFPFKRNRLRLRCVNENRKKRKRLRWQAANHGCHGFDRAFLLSGACVCYVKMQRTQRKRLRLNGNQA